MSSGLLWVFTPCDCRQSLLGDCASLVASNLTVCPEQIPTLTPSATTARSIFDEILALTGRQRLQAKARHVLVSHVASLSGVGIASTIFLVRSGTN